MATYKELLENTIKFKRTAKFPTVDNLIENRPEIAPELVEKQANDTRIILHKDVLDLCEEFLKLKQEFGNPVELEVYKGLCVDEFISRLILKRPLAFLNRNDLTLLRDGTKLYNGFKSWIKVGSLEQDDFLQLKDYLSYEEMLISALIGVSVSTSFINDGNLYNCGVYNSKDDNFTKEGIYIGLVGCRFEREEVMECQTLACRLNQNAYADKLPPYISELWARFYGIDLEKFNSKAFVQSERIDLSRYVYFKDGSKSILDLNLFEKRIRITLETLLLEANLRGKDVNKKAHVRALGLGLGIWLAHERQKVVFVETLKAVLESLPLSNIKSVEILHLFIKPTETINTKTGSQVQLTYTKGFPASKVDEKLLLVTCYPWDSNAFPGNEYWLGSLSASGDPAAACCSFLPQLQNPYINPFCQNICILYTDIK